jgi:tetratricopeptide (TPR) repeat protein
VSFKSTVAENLFSKGLKYERKKNITLALLYYNKADSVEPNNSITLHTRGMLKSNSGNFRAGLLDINLSIQFVTDSVIKKSYICNRGSIYYENNILDSACIDWKSAGKYDLGNYRKHCK